MRKTIVWLLCGMLLVALGGGAWANEDVSKEQALHQYAIRRAEGIIDLGPFKTWPVEEKAALDRMLSDAGIFEPLYILPTEGDLSQEDALLAAKAAIAQEYGSSDSLDRFGVYASFLRVANGKQWEFQFGPVVEAPELGMYMVDIASPSGNMVLCQWYAGEQTDEAIQAMAGAEPASGSLTEDEAVRLARQAVQAAHGQAFGLTEKVLSGFEADAVFDADEAERPVWQVELEFDDVDVDDILGSYVVYLDAVTGEIIKVENSDARVG